MSNYAVGYTVGDGEPQKDSDGGEYIPEHAVPIVDGVAVAEQPAVVEDEDEQDGEAGEGEADSATSARRRPARKTASKDDDSTLSK